MMALLSELLTFTRVSTAGVLVQQFFFFPFSSSDMGGHVLSKLLAFHKGVTEVISYLTATQSKLYIFLRYSNSLLQDMGGHLPSLGRQPSITRVSRKSSALHCNLTSLPQMLSTELTSEPFTGVYYIQEICSTHVCPASLGKLPQLRFQVPFHVSGIMPLVGLRAIDLHRGITYSTHQLS